MPHNSALHGKLSPTSGLACCEVPWHAGPETAGWPMQALQYPRMPGLTLMQHCNRQAP